MTTAVSQLPYQTSPSTLARASVAAIIGATTILTLFVLPAEWGIDPTGVGKVLGLTRMAGAEDSADTAVAIPETTAAATMTIPPQTKESIAVATPMRSDEKTLTLAPHTGMEIKAHMLKGDRFVFRWTATGAIRQDMHGEPTKGRPGEFSTYWKQKDMTEAQGSFIAPFNGSHGWYWRNGGETPVTITLKTTGFYNELFEPPAE